MTTRVCSIDGCTEPAAPGRNHCVRHRRWRARYGTYDPPLPRCAEPGCDFLVRWGVHCGRHHVPTGGPLDVAVCAEPAPYDWLDKDCLLAVEPATGRVMAGYGAIARKRANRWRWEQAFGPIPAGLHVLHRCDNPPCVELTHLYLGTQADNMRDMRERGRWRRAGGDERGA